MSDRVKRLQAACLYLVCDDRPAEFLHGALRGGVDIVQLRMKSGSDAAILGAARRFAEACRQHGALFILNDRPDLVAAAGADGVHVGQVDVPASQARSLVGRNRVVGVSTHSPAQVDAVLDADVDYIGVGPVHETPTKPGRKAVGLDLVGYAARHASIPFFAIGGITTGNAASVLGAGARRIAVVRALTEADDPEQAARELTRILRSGSPAPAAPREAGVGST